MISNEIIQNTQTTKTETTAVFALPTRKIDKTVNTISNLSPQNKIIIGSGIGIILLAIGGIITYCCYKSRQRAERRRQMQISYPLAPLSPTLRRRR